MEKDRKRQIEEAIEQVDSMRIMNMDVSQYSPEDLKESRALLDSLALKVLCSLAQSYLAGDIGEYRKNSIRPDGTTGRYTDDMGNLYGRIS